MHDVYILPYISLIYFVLEVVHTGPLGQAAPKPRARKTAAPANAPPSLAPRTVEKTAAGAGAWLQAQAAAAHTRTTAARAANAQVPIQPTSVASATVAAGSFRNPARGKKLPPFPADIAEPARLDDPPTPEESDLDDEDLYRHRPRPTTSSSRRVVQDSEDDDDDDGGEGDQGAAPESEDDGDHRLVRVELNDDIDMDDEPAMLAQAAKNSQEPPPLMDFYGDGGVSEGGDVSDGSDEELYEVNAHGKRVHSRAPRNTKQHANRPPKAADYDPHTKTKIFLACSLLAAIGAAEDPFPSNEATIEMAGFAWETVLEKLEAFPVDEAAEWFTIVSSPSFFVDLLTNLFSFEIARTFPQFRGHVRDRVRPKIAEAYGFDERPRRVEFNRALYLQLVEGDAFVCEVCMAVQLRLILTDDIYLHRIPRRKKAIGSILFSTRL